MKTAPPATSIIFHRVDAPPIEVIVYGITPAELMVAGGKDSPSRRLAARMKARGFHGTFDGLSIRPVWGIRE